jgi:hypothetical protein
MHSRTVGTGRQGRIAAWAAALLAVSSLAWADIAEDQKTHTLFMGADISVGYKNGIYPVQDMMGSSWLIDVNGERRQIATKDQHVDIRTVPTMKLTRVSATVTHLVTERGYTTDNDPSVRLTRDLAESAKLNFGYQVFNGQVAQLTQAAGAQGHAGSLTQAMNTVASSDLRELLGSGGASPQSGMNTFSVADAGSAAAAQNLAGGSAGGDLEMYGRRGLSLGFNALHVSFDIVTDHVIKRPYIVTFTRFREKKAKPNEVKMLIYATELHQLDPRPQSIDLLEGGFPPEYEMISCQLHLYEGRKEIATTVAPKRVELTGDEAFEYLKMDYVATHKGETVVASPLMGSLPADFPETLKSGRYAQDFFVHVSKDGIPEGAYRDAARREPLNDPVLEAILQNIRFQPALDKGTPVEGMAPVNLRRLEL